MKKKKNKLEPALKIFQPIYLQRPTEKTKAKAKFLAKIFYRLGIEKESEIIELGCGLGNNLAELELNGFTNLLGVEINSEFLRMKEREYENFKYRIKIQSAEKFIFEVKNPIKNIICSDILYFIESADFFINLVEKVIDYLFISENEKSLDKQYMKRNYKEVFEDLGMKEILSLTSHSFDNMRGKNKIRVFKKSDKI